MFSYKDMTFCPFEKCEKFKECERALTNKIRLEADRFGCPISQFGREPECYVPSFM